MEEIQELIGMEQFLNTLPANKRLWVMERKPKTCIQAGDSLTNMNTPGVRSRSGIRKTSRELDRSKNVHFVGKHSEDVCYKKTTNEETSRLCTCMGLSSLRGGALWITM